MFTPASAAGAPAPQVITVTREQYPHLNDGEWAAYTRLAEQLGESAVAVMLRGSAPEQQHATIAAFLVREAQDAQARVTLLEDSARSVQAMQGRLASLEQSQAVLANAATAPTAQPRPRVTAIKLDVAKYRGNQGESLLRWFVELDEAIRARLIVDDTMKVAFGMSNLAGRARTWAYGRKLAAPSCFPTLDVFKRELRSAFEPPKTEFRARSEFLEIKQAKRDVHAYAQTARYLVSCIVAEPIDEAKQVVTFMKGLNDGPIKTHLFRVYPQTMEDAISLAIQEDFSMHQAYFHSADYRPRNSFGKGNRQTEEDTVEPMDLSSAKASLPRSKGKCSRCQKPGHWAYECLAPKPVANASRGNNRRGGKSPRSKSGAAKKPQQPSGAKNSKSQ